MKYLETRKVDEVGRVVLPKTLREQMLLQNNVDSVDFYVNDGAVVIKPTVSKCVVCKSETGEQFRDVYFCSACKSELAKK